MMHIVNLQRELYGLTLQKVTMCKTETPLPSVEPNFSDEVFDEDTRAKWLPVYSGCCTYQFRRHFAVVVAEPSGTGSVVLTAALIQSRSRYARFLRYHCDSKLTRWR